jgi:hypothetical protein
MLRRVQLENLISGSCVKLRNFSGAIVSACELNMVKIST